jgi:hypothetical protein
MVEEGIVAFHWAQPSTITTGVMFVASIVTLNVTERHDTGRHFNSKNKPVLEVQPVTASPLRRTKKRLSQQLLRTLHVFQHGGERKSTPGSFEGRGRRGWIDQHLT